MKILKITILFSLLLFISFSSILILPSYTQKMATGLKGNESADDNNMLLPIVVALISAGVSVFSLYRNENTAKLSRKHENLLAESKQEYDAWLASITDARVRELADAKQGHETKLAEWKAEREKELADAKRADDLMMEQWRLEREEKRARRDYQYDAREHIYEEFEPFLFQLNEFSGNALRRIKGFSRNAKEGYLKVWLLTEDGYYMISTIYRFAAPLAVFKVMQRKLTAFDLNLDPCIKIQYLLVKALYHTFSHDFKLAQNHPTLNYSPHNIVNYEMSSVVAGLEGIFLGLIDQLAEVMIKEENNKLRIISYGEFENKYLELKNSLQLKNNYFKAIINLFLNFHPKEKPVLWRILLAQAHIYMAMIKMSELSSDSCRDLKPLRILSKNERNIFDWRQSPRPPKKRQMMMCWKSHLWL